LEGWLWKESRWFRIWRRRYAELSLSGVLRTYTSRPWDVSHQIPETSGLTSLDGFASPLQRGFGATPGPPEPICELTDVLNVQGGQHWLADAPARQLGGLQNRFQLVISAGGRTLVLAFEDTEARAAWSSALFACSCTHRPVASVDAHALHRQRCVESVPPRIWLEHGDDDVSAVVSPATSLPCSPQFTQTAEGLSAAAPGTLPSAVESCKARHATEVLQSVVAAMPHEVETRQSFAPARVTGEQALDSVVQAADVVQRQIVEDTEIQQSCAQSDSTSSSDACPDRQHGRRDASSSQQVVLDEVVVVEPQALPSAPVMADDAVGRPRLPTGKGKGEGKGEGKGKGKGKQQGKGPPAPKPKPKPKPQVLPLGRRLSLKTTQADLPVFRSTLVLLGRSSSSDSQVINESAASVSTPAGVTSPSVDPSAIDLVALCEAFALQPRPSRAKRKSLAARVEVLPHAVAQRLAIVMTRLRIDTVKLASALEQLNPAACMISAEDARLLLQVWPKHDDLQPLEEFAVGGRDTATLRDLERQILPLVKLARMSSRLRLVVLAGTLDERVADTLDHILKLQAACRKLQTSSILRDLFVIIFVLFNYVNFGAQGVAPEELRGFDVQSLLRLQETRASKGPFTGFNMLHYVLIELSRQRPALTSQHLMQELGVLPSATGVTLAGLREDLARLRGDQELVLREMCDHREAYEPMPPPDLSQTSCSDAEIVHSEEALLDVGATSDILRDFDMPPAVLDQERGLHVIDIGADSDASDCVESSTLEAVSRPPVNRQKSCLARALSRTINFATVVGHWLQGDEVLGAPSLPDTNDGSPLVLLSHTPISNLLASGWLWLWLPAQEWIQCWGEVRSCALVLYKISSGHCHGAVYSVLPNAQIIPFGSLLSSDVAQSLSETTPHGFEVKSAVSKRVLQLCTSEKCTTDAWIDMLSIQTRVRGAGWLQIHYQGRKLMSSAWQRKHYCCCHDGRLLAYSRPRDYIEMRLPETAWVITEVDIKEFQDLGLPFGFELRCRRTGRLWQFACETSVDHHAWLEELRRHQHGDGSSECGPRRTSCMLVRDGFSDLLSDTAFDTDASTMDPMGGTPRGLQDCRLLTESGGEGCSEDVPSLSLLEETRCGRMSELEEKATPLRNTRLPSPQLRSAWPISSALAPMTPGGPVQDVMTPGTASAPSPLTTSAMSPLCPPREPPPSRMPSMCVEAVLSAGDGRTPQRLSHAPCDVKLSAISLSACAANEETTLEAIDSARSLHMLGSSSARSSSCAPQVRSRSPHACLSSDHASRCSSCCDAGELAAEESDLENDIGQLRPQGDSCVARLQMLDRRLGQAVDQVSHALDEAEGDARSLLLFFGLKAPEGPHLSMDLLQLLESVAQFTSQVRAAWGTLERHQLICQTPASVSVGAVALPTSAANSGLGS